MVNTFIHSSEHRGSKGLPSERGFVKNRSELRFPKFKLVLKILIKNMKYRSTASCSINKIYTQIYEINYKYNVRSTTIKIIPP